MLEFRRFLLLPNCFLFFLFFSFAIFVVKAQEEQIILTNCPSSSANYTSGSQYETNLKALLPSLASKAVPRIDTYYNTSVGTGTDHIYGYAQCMSAATADSCRACLNKSISEVIGERCPNKRSATIRYYSCIVRYSDRRFFSESDDSLAVFRTSQFIVTELSVFNAQLSSLMQNLSTEAAFNSSRLAWGKAPYDEFSDIYGLAQCTRDLSPTACSSCLSGTISRIPSCCRNKTGGWVYFPTCNIRFRTSPFDPADRLPPLPVPPPAPPDGAATPSPLLPDSPSSLSTYGTNKSKTNIIVVISSVSAAVVAVIGIILCIYLSRRKEKWKKMPDANEDDMRSSESLLFDLGTLRAATNDFSLTNKVGQGGFGPVYKGTLPDGRDIAIKRLQATSSQGMAEFKNELNLVAKLQHRNLVKLWGCCAKDQEKLLVYEYVPNSSLDRFLFADATNSARLDWSTRYKIIVGIARGLLYLHEDSRLRIIHRDLKASNILLDKDMNPKISDFGLARLFGGNETQGNTSCIVGTYGYMPPEYAMQGRYSTKSDVYSFGVLVLEIVTGRKNSGSALSEPSLDLLSYIWRHWNEGRMTDLMDQSMGEDYQRKEALRCIHLGLLCVQDDPTERPLMSTIVLMLSRYTIKLPVPSRPAYCTKSSGMSRDDNNSRGLDMPWTGSSQLTNSINVVTISELDPR